MQTTHPLDNLIYDVGMHEGEDTEFYLKKGFRVIAFEANPDLVSLNAKKLFEYIDKNLLTIVSGAIVDLPHFHKVTFYQNLDNNVWSTADADWAARFEKLGTKNRMIEVDAVDFTECLKRFGIPYYMKIDIEGAEMVCLNSLSEFAARPSYLSLESDKLSFDKVLNEINMLELLGYSQFMAVQQADVHLINVPYPPKEGGYVPYKFPKGSSGLFGKELNGNWRSKEQIMSEYASIFRDYLRYGEKTFWQQNKCARRLLSLRSKILRKPIPGWYDTHARHSNTGV